VELKIILNWSRIRAASRGKALIVCSCHGVTDREIRRIARDGARTLRAVAESCGAGDGCGGCRASVRAILLEHAERNRKATEGTVAVSLAAEPA
jgi:bacterioferritin-associated ferredoxin